MSIKILERHLSILLDPMYTGVSLILCGLGYVLMAGVCFALSRWQRSPLPWLWLGLFAAFHREGSWLETVIVALLLAATWVSIVRFSRRSARELAASALRYESLFQGTDNSISLFDTSGRFTAVNAAGYRGLGLPEEELVGRSLTDLWEGSEREEIRQAVDAVLNGEKRSLDVAYTRPEGSVLAYRLVLSPILEPGGKVAGFACIWNDTTRSRQAERRLQESLQFVETLVNAIPQPIFYKDTSGKFLGCNDAFADFIGVPREKIAGSTVSDFSPPDLAEIYRQADLALLADAGVQAYESQVRRSDGSSRSVAFRKAVFLDPDGKPAGIIGTVQDITERKKAEESLAALNECLLSFGPDCRANIESLVTVCGTLLGGACALYNRLDDELLKNASAWNAPADFETVDRAEGHVCTDVARAGGEEMVVIRDLPSTSYAQSDPNVAKYALRTYLGRAIRCAGKSIGTLCVVYQTDYEPSTSDRRVLEIVASAIESEEERVRAQEELLASEAKFSLAFRSSPLIVGLSRVSDGKFVDVSDSFVQVTGYTREETIGRSALTMQIWANASERDRVLQEIARDGSVRGREVAFRAKSGETIWALCSMETIMIDGEPHLLNAAMDITDRKAVQNALEESEFRYRDLFENASDYIVTFDLSGKLTSVNRAAEEAMGYSASDNINMYDIVAPEYHTKVKDTLSRKLLGEEAESHYELEVIDRSGNRRRIELKSRMLMRGEQPHELQVIARDVTERRRFEDALAWEARVNSAMAEISSAVLSTSSIESMSELVLEKARRLTGSQCGFVGYVDPRIDCLVCPTLGDDLLNSLYPLGTGTEITEEDGFAGWVLNHDGALLINDSSRLPRLSMPGCARAVTNLLSVPATYGDTLVGQIVLANTGHGYSERHLSCLEKLASLYAIAVRRKRTEEELHIQTSAINATSDQVIITDRQGRIEFVNPAFELETGYKLDEVMGRSPGILSSGKQNSEFYARMWNTIGSGETWQGEMINRYKNGKLAVEDMTITPVRDENGSVQHFVAIKRNVTLRKEYEEQLDYLAYHDPLTGLPNRLLFSDRLTHRLATARVSGQQLAVLFLDVDQFKLINDTLGHKIGDALLKGVAERLQSCLRDVDTIARMGGDEFTVIISNVQNEEAVVLVANRIIETLHEPFELDKHELFVTVSVGISIYPQDGLDVETLVRNADTAMYRAKDRGRNNYQMFTEAFNTADVERMTLEYGLRRALERGEFLLHYQPQVDMKTGQTLGAEALIRWRHPKFGLVSPGKFIPLAEETGLIVPISKWVLYTACAQNKAWQSAGHQPMRVAVNVSARLLHQDDLVATVSNVLSQTGMDARYLELELTESALMENTDMAIAVLERIKQMGVKVSVDDFGTGYSSLSYLKRFPIDSVKIDQSFIRDITNNPDDAAIAGAVVAMAHSLKLKVIAEGVETLEQLEFLKSLKCDEIQGYFVSRPVPAEDFQAMLDEVSATLWNDTPMRRAA